jgi:hypothetical protein
MNNKAGAAIKREKVGGKLILSLVFFLALTSLSCANQRILESSNNSMAETSSTPASAQAPDDVRDNLGAVERMGFDFVYVFTRPDAGVFTGEDKMFLKDNSPSETNQWRLTKDGKTVIAATNYKFPPESLTILQTRFNVEDRSPKIDEKVNANSNTIK